MADTDDPQTLELDQHEQGDDGDTEAAGKRHEARFREQRNERPAAVAGLTPEEETAAGREVELVARREEEREAAEDETVELAAAEQRALEEQKRSRDELLAAGSARAMQETERAIQLAETDRDRDRALAGDERRRAVHDDAHGENLVNESAVKQTRDEPGADATVAAGHAAQRLAADERLLAAEYDRRADGYDEARARRGQARQQYDDQARQQEQPDPVQAVRNPPAAAPAARKYVHPKLEKKRTSADRSGEPDLSLD